MQLLIDGIVVVVIDDDTSVDDNDDDAFADVDDVSSGGCRNDANDASGVVGVRDAFAVDDDVDTSLPTDDAFEFSSCCCGCCENEGKIDGEPKYCSGCYYCEESLSYNGKI